jgi:hypothetical protein
MNANESLKEFLSAYFHEDWALDARSPRDVVAKFFHYERSVDVLRSIAEALRALIDSDADDSTLSERLFREFGGYFDPRGDGESTRGWLISLAEEFEREIARRR